MNFTESFFTAMDSLRMNKLRALLTMLGIIIGVAAVIALMALGNGFGDYIEQQISSIGTNLLFVATDRDNSNGYPALALSDVEALNNANLPSVAAIAASLSSAQNVTSMNESQRANIMGVTQNYFNINNLDEMEAGGIFTTDEIDSAARVVVLGYEVANTLFVDSYPIGESVRINGTQYEVVGVVSEQGAGFGTTDTNVFIPISTAQRRLATARTRLGELAVTGIIVQATDSDNIEMATTQVADLLREQHQIAYASADDFTVTSQTSLLETVGAITGTLTLVLGAIAGISLLVGGIGIMNIMLVSVTERTREIGIRKAIGALQRDILVQFLIESLVLSVIGGILGIALGWTLATVAGNLAKINAGVTLPTIALATGFSMAVGLIFGIYPAWRAARLRPIEALRYE